MVPDRAFALRVGAALAMLAGCLLAVRTMAQVLPLGLCLAVALVVVVMVPGFAVARSLRLDDMLEAPLLAAATVPLGCAAWSIGLMAGLAARLPLYAVAAAVALFSVSALAASPPRIQLAGVRAQLGGVALGGVLLAVIASRYETPLHGDALFHAGRVRKLLDLPELSLSGLSSVWHGAPHAGYVVPVLHAIDAVAIGITGAEPSGAYSSLGPGSALMLPLVVFALGATAGGRAVGVAVSLLAVWDVIARGSLESMQQPPTFTFFVLMPAVLALLLATARAGFERRLTWALLLSLLAITLIHSTYTVVPLVCMAAVVILTRQGFQLLAAAVVLTGAIYGAIWAVSLRGGAPLPPRPVLDTVFVTAGGHPIVAQAQWMLDQRLEIALGVAAVVPLLLLYHNRHALAASIMAGALVLCAFPGVPALLTDLIGYGQVKRFPRGGLPWALTAGIALVEISAIASSRGVVPLAVLLALESIVYQTTDLGYAATAAIAAITIAGVIVVVVLALRRQPYRVNPASGAALASMVLLTLAVIAGSARAVRSQVAADLRHGPAFDAPPPRLPGSVVAYFRQHDQPPFPVVLADAHIGYQLAGQADIYSVALPLERARGELRNAPNARSRAVNIALSPGASDALRMRIFKLYHVRYVLVNETTTPASVRALSADADLRQVFRNGGWVAFATRG
jgi:hypothetical protein